MIGRRQPRPRCANKMAHLASSLPHPMKVSPLLLAGSLAANAALCAALAWQPTLAPPALRPFLFRHFSFGDAGPATPAPVARRAPPEHSKLWTALANDDLATLIARLRAAGFPPAVIREIIRANVSARYSARLRALTDPDPDTPFWRLPSQFATAGASTKRNEEINQLQRERAKLLRDLLAGDLFATGDVTAAQRRQFGDLPRPKIDQLQRVEDDYAEMNAAVRSAMNGIMLPEDRDKLALLNREKQADLAAILTPEELADYTMRSSPITAILRTRLGAFDPTEDEYRAIFRVQQSLNDQFPSGSLVTDFESRQAAQKQLEAQLQSTLGDARYADYSRATNREFQQLSRLAERANLPAETAVQAFGARDSVAQESNRIFNDAALSYDDKKAALQSLAQNTRAQLLATLGPTAGAAYVKIADSWLTNVERGNAVTFAANNGMSWINSNGATVSLGGSYPSFRRLPNPNLPPPRP